MMHHYESTVEVLRARISACEAELDGLHRQLAEAEAHSRLQHSSSESLSLALNGGVPDDLRTEVLAALLQTQDHLKKYPLDKNEYTRYGRQLIMPEVGLQGQLRLKQSSVLIVGAGGLGCPAAAYLAGAGVGTIGLVDGDVVEASNLHRQILHSTPKINMLKVDSAILQLRSLNPNLNYIAHTSHLSPDTALELMKPYSLILDCTDNPATRYLISDACVLLGKPLVSASALRTEGQLMCLNIPPRPPGDPSGGPCYRCVFPKPPPADSVVTCGEGGILGPVVGTMGVLQALEAIKLITKGIGLSNGQMNAAAGNGSSAEKPQSPSLLLFSAYGDPPFRSIRLRSRKPKCAACSAVATITPQALNCGSMDYIQFCGVTHPVNVLSLDERVAADEYAKMKAQDLSNTEHILVDVREQVQFDLCNLEGSINIPFSTISATPNAVLTPASAPTPATVSSPGSDEQAMGMALEQASWVSQLQKLPSEKPIIIVCRLGNDSQLAVKKMKELGLDFGGQRWIGDISGGLRAWRTNVDEDFPDY